MYRALMDLYRERRMLPFLVAPVSNRCVHQQVLEEWLPPVTSLFAPVVAKGRRCVPREAQPG